MASMAGASVGIGAGRFPAGKRDKKSKKRKKQQENIDNILIDDVMKLIMERGILR